MFTSIFGSLKIGKCRMAVAAPEDYVEDPDRTFKGGDKNM